MSSRKWIGEAAHSIDLYKTLQQQGHTPLLICRKGFDVEIHARKNNLNYYPLTLKGNFNGIDDLADILKLRRIIKDHNIDIIHCHRGKDHWIAAAASFTLKNSPPIIRTRHVVTPVKNHLFNRWLYSRLTDYIIAVSRKSLESFGELSEIIKSKSKIIYSSVDQEKFNPTKRNDRLRKELGATSENTKLIGLVGRIQKIKGQKYFIRAAKNIAEQIPDVKFLTIGKGFEYKIQQLKNEAEELGINDKINFIGYREDIASIIGSLDVGVVCSLGSEGSSRITYEYMASGVPVVATKVGGIPEVIRDGENGLLIEPKNPDQISDAVIKILKSPDLKTKFTNNSLKLIQEKFTRQRWINEILEVYQAVKKN